MWVCDFVSETADTVCSCLRMVNFDISNKNVLWPLNGCTRMLLTSMIHHSNYTVPQSIYSLMINLIKSRDNWFNFLYFFSFSFYSSLDAHFTLVRRLIWWVMVVSSGFLDHAAEVYLRASDSIMSAQPIASSNVREWSQQLQQQTIASNQLNAQNSAIKVNSVQHSAAARVILLCQPNSHPFQVSVLQS